MYIKIQDENFNTESLPVIALLTAESEPETVSLDPLRGEMRDFCRRVVINEGFRGEAGKLLVVPVAGKTVRYAVIAGLGPEDKITPERVRAAAFSAARAAASRGCAELSITMPKGGAPRSYAVIENGVFTIKDTDGETVLTTKL